MNVWYGRDGQPITVQEWESLYRDNRVALTVLRTDEDGNDEIFASTVWLGIDHSFGRDARPVIFETMAFGVTDDLLDNPCERYCTEEEARIGHDRMVYRVAAELDDTLPKAVDAPQNLLTPVDVIDRIDALVNEQLAGFNDRSGYDHNVNQTLCPRWECEEEFHGLPITLRMHQMRMRGYVDAEYRHNTDESPVLCPGSTFVGPMLTPTQQQARKVRRKLSTDWVGPESVTTLAVLRERQRAFRDQVQQTIFGNIDSSSIGLFQQAAPAGFMDRGRGPVAEPRAEGEANNGYWVPVEGGWVRRDDLAGEEHRSEFVHWAPNGEGTNYDPQEDDSPWVIYDEAYNEAAVQRMQREAAVPPYMFGDTFERADSTLGGTVSVWNGGEHEWREIGTLAGPVNFTYTNEEPWPDQREPAPDDGLEGPLWLPPPEE